MKKEKFKKEVVKQAKRLVERRINEFEVQIARLQETKVAPASEEIDLVYNSQNEANHEISNQLARNLDESVRSLARLELIEISGNFSTKVEPEAVVVTNQGIFFISVHTSNFTIDNKEVMCISTLSPIYLKMIDMEKGDRFNFRDISYTIEDIF